VEEAGELLARVIEDCQDSLLIVEVVERKWCPLLSRIRDTIAILILPADHSLLRRQVQGVVLERDFSSRGDYPDQPIERVQVIRNWGLPCAEPLWV
jgi:hypothetical protein